jgi:hypothetical protein
MRLRKWCLLVLVALAATFVPAGEAAAYAITASGGCESNRAGDFNGDDFDDLAIGVPGEASGRGAVNVVYGDEAGLDQDESDQFFTQDSPAAMDDVAEPGDHFGACLGVGNFNGDGFDDLAIGVPDEDVGSILEAGAVNVVYGSSTGLNPSTTTRPDQFITQNTSGIEGSSEPGDHFGFGLAAGDFNIDERDDLAVGVPDEDVGTISDAGSVNVIHGAAGTVGLNASSPLPDQLWFQDSPGISGSSETNDEMGASLTAADFNNDGREDLAIGNPGESVGTKASAGAVSVLYGSVSAGLNANNDQMWSQDSGGVPGQSETGDKFGDALTNSDLDDDGFPDLFIGAPTENVGTEADAGAVNWLRGSSNRLTASGTLFTDDTGGGTVEEDDQFGAALAGDELNPEEGGEGGTYVLIAAPGEDDDAGQVTLLSSGLVPPILYQDPSPTIDDRYGSALTTGDYDADGCSDFTVGVPFKEVGTEDDAGHVVVEYCIGLVDEEVHSQDNLLDDPDDDDNFGSALG